MNLRLSGTWCVLESISHLQVKPGWLWVPCWEDWFSVIWLIRLIVKFPLKRFFWKFSEVFSKHKSIKRLKYVNSLGERNCLSLASFFSVYWVWPLVFLSTSKCLCFSDFLLDSSFRFVISLREFSMSVWHEPININQGFMYAPFVLLCETFPVHQRENVGIMSQIFWSFASCLSPVLAYYVENWRYYQMCLSLFSVFLLPFF